MTFMFGINRTKPSRKDAKRIELLAKEHDCDWIEANLSGIGYQSWFVGTNLGEPFDKALKEQVLSALQKEGLR